MTLQFLDLVGQINQSRKQSLTNRQIEAARAIFNQSVVNGIDPRVTLSMAMQESNLGMASIGDKDRGEDHALGSMQVLRSTARSMGLESDWLESKKQAQSTGYSNAELDAKMGVAYVKRLIDNHGAKQLSDVAAGYNGGPGKIGKNYGKAQDYVNKVSRNMGVLFGDGRPVDWKTSVAIAPQAPLAPLSAESSMPAPIRPTTPSSMQVGYQGSEQADMASTLSGAYPTTPYGSMPDVSLASIEPTGIEKTLSDPMAQVDNFLRSISYQPALQTQEDNPMDRIKSILAQQYDQEYMSESA